ncbi:MAG TPA: hypothetical protein VF518_06255 [Polyangia bacterium]
MTRLPSSLCFSFAIAATTLGCNPATEGEVDQFRNGVPRAATVTMTVPGAAASGQALTAESTSQALLGETAQWYQTTRAVTGVVNGAALAVGGLVNLIIKYPPTTIAQDEAVWGPWEDPLDPVAWKVTINRVAEHMYQYKFEGRPRTDPTAAFVIVLSGAHTPALNARGREIERFGSGSFTLDWDARATLPQPDNNVGKVDFSYQHLGAGEPVSITAHFRQVKDDDRPGQQVDADYAFAQTPRGPGSMDFVYITPPTATETGSRGVVHSRWLFSGAGRSDVQLKTTDGTVAGSLSECWDLNYASVYKQDSWLGGDHWGAESACSAFPTVEFSTLK